MKRDAKRAAIILTATERRAWTIKSTNRKHEARRARIRAKAEKLARELAAKIGRSVAVLGSRGGVFLETSSPRSSPPKVKKNPSNPESEACAPGLGCFPVPEPREVKGRGPKDAEILKERAAFDARAKGIKKAARKRSSEKCAEVKREAKAKGQEACGIARAEVSDAKTAALAENLKQTREELSRLRRELYAAKKRQTRPQELASSARRGKRGTRRGRGAASERVEEEAENLPKRLRPFFLKEGATYLRKADELKQRGGVRAHTSAHELWLDAMGIRDPDDPQDWGGGDLKAEAIRRQEAEGEREIRDHERELEREERERLGLEREALEDQEAPF